MSDGVLIAIVGLAGVLVAGLPALITALTSRRIALQTRAHTETLVEAIGPKNGSDVVTKLSNLEADVKSFGERLDSQTHVTRAGATEPEDLGPYMQTWFHEINTSLTILYGTLGLMWNKLKPHYELGDLPPLKPKDKEPT